MSYLHLPLFQALAPTRRVLLAGMGGGFDVFSSLPLFFGLRDAGKEVFLANLSFSDLDNLPGPQLHPSEDGPVANHRATR